MKMKVSFTGTRDGMSETQKGQLVFVLAALGKQGVVHKFGYGTHTDATLISDAWAAEAAKRMGYEPVPFDAGRGEELQRNRKQVGWSDVLIAAPRGDKELIRSGTWATVRYAREAGIPVIMLSRGSK